MLHFNVDDSPTRERQKLNSNFGAIQDAHIVSGLVAENCNRDIVVTYHKNLNGSGYVTLGGTFKAYFEGTLIPQLKDGWVSQTHPIPTETTIYYLKYNDVDGFTFNDEPWIFKDMMIAAVQIIFTSGVETSRICMREVHGATMSPATHRNLHYNIGTTRLPNGLTFTNWVAGSVTPANRQPYISGVVLIDEDLETAINALSTNAYTQRYLVGSTSARTFAADQTEIVKLTGNQPLFNQWTGSAWTDTPFPNNDYGAIFVVAVPVAENGANTNTQSYRYMFVQPQQTSGDLSVIQKLTPSDLTHGESASLLAEYSFVGKIIIRYTASNWSITSIDEITGNKSQQISGALTYGLATSTTNGLMSFTDKTRLDDASGVNGYVKCNGAGDFSVGVAGTTSVMGLLSTTDKTRLDDASGVNGYVKCNGAGDFSVGANVTTSVDGLMAATSLVTLNSLDSLVTHVVTSAAAATAAKGSIGTVLTGQILELELTNGNTAASPTIIIDGVNHTITGMPTVAKVSTSANQLYKLKKTGATALTYIGGSTINNVYVTESGTDANGWYYERYSNGKAMCNILHDIGTINVNTVLITIVAGTAVLYYTTAGIGHDFPFTFATITYTETVVQKNSSGYCIVLAHSGVTAICTTSTPGTIAVGRIMAAAASLNNVILANRTEGTWF